MAFERLEVRVRPPAEKSPAAIGLSMWGARRSGKPIVIVSLHADLVEQARFDASSRFNVFIGTGDDSGKLRLSADPRGIVPARVFKTTKAFFVNLGYVEQIGSAPARKTPTDARVISPGTVEIDIPEFDFEPEINYLPAPAKPEATAPGKSGMGEIFLNGISIDLTDGEETITFDGEGIAVDPLEARLVKLLARPRPAPVAETFLIANLWDGKAPKNAPDIIRQLCAGDLKKGLAKLGLVLAPVKGVGYQLKDA